MAVDRPITPVSSGVSEVDSGGADEDASVSIEAGARGQVLVGLRQNHHSINEKCSRFCLRLSYRTRHLQTLRML